MTSEPKPANRFRVLVVEDQPSDVELLRRYLDRIHDAEFELEHVGSVEQAVARLRESEFDVSLCDLHLPDSQGLDTVVTLHQAAPAVPLVILTDSDDEQLAMRCLAAGAQDYLDKASLSDVNLRRVIGFAVSRAREVLAQEIRIRELESLLGRYRQISSAGRTTVVTGRLAASGAVQERAPNEFGDLARRYVGVLPAYLHQLTVQAPKPMAEMTAVVTALGDLGGGPRDLVDLHLAALERANVGKSDVRARAMATEGRLLALEMMGLLVEYYRAGLRSGTGTMQ